VPGLHRHQRSLLVCGAAARIVVRGTMLRVLGIRGAEE
jgi:hypothetical protein